jgi:hypothetical protein
MIRVIDDPSVSSRVTDVPRWNVAPSRWHTAAKANCELVRVAGAVGRVVNGTGESPLPVAQRRFEGHGLLVVEHVLAPAVFGQQS